MDVAIGASLVKHMLVYSLALAIKIYILMLILKEEGHIYFSVF